MKKITSVQNPEIKRVQLLQRKSRERKKQQTFVIEGVREVRKALKAGYILERIFVCETAKDTSFLQIVAQEKVLIWEVSATVFEKISFRSGTEKAIFMAKTKTHLLSTFFKLPKHPSVLVLEAPEKPGNIGALFRTAVAAKMDAIIIANPKTDLYHPNCIRSSLGTLFQIPVAMATAEAVLTYLQKHKITVLVAALHSKSESYHRFVYPSASALVMGAEDKGVTALWQQQAEALLEIPMSGKVDSLNLSVSAGILMYELQKSKNRLS